MAHEPERSVVASAIAFEWREAECGLLSGAFSEETKAKLTCETTRAPRHLGGRSMHHRVAPDRNDDDHDHHHRANDHDHHNGATHDYHDGTADNDHDRRRPSRCVHLDPESRRVRIDGPDRRPVPRGRVDQRHPG